MNADTMTEWHWGAKEGGPDPDIAWEALAKLQGIVQKIQATDLADTGQYVYKYLSLDGLFDALREPFEECGLTVHQQSQPSLHAGDIDMRTRFRHSSGNWVELGLIMPRGVDGQKAGGIITYGRRYAVGAHLGIVIGKDDDARQASPPAAAASDVKAVQRRFKALGDEYKQKIIDAMQRNEWPTMSGVGVRAWNADQLADAEKLAHRLEVDAAQVAKAHAEPEPSAPPEQAAPPHMNQADAPVPPPPPEPKAAQPITDLVADARALVASTANAAEVLAWAERDPAHRAAVLAAEMAKPKPRKAVTRQLERMMASNGDQFGAPGDYVGAADQSIAESDGGLPYEAPGHS